MWNRSKGLSEMSSLPDSSVIEAEKWFILHGRVDHRSKNELRYDLKNLLSQPRQSELLGQFRESDPEI